MSSIDKLALTCRLLYDQRVLEQRKEIEKLEVKLFFKDYTEGNLKIIINNLNWNMKCKCMVCSIVGRICDDDAKDLNAVCTFVPWLDNVLHERGFVVLRQTCVYDRCDGPYEECFYKFDKVPFIDADCHLVEHVLDVPVTGNVIRWRYISIGKRLWNAESINDQQIKQFKRVFNISSYGYLSSPPRPPLSPKMAPHPPPPLPITTTINQGLELQALKEQLATKDLELLALKAQLATQAAETQTLQLDYVRDDTDNKRKRP